MQLKKRVITTICFLVLVMLLSVGVFGGCGRPLVYGIPVGHYRRVDKYGNFVIPGGGEFGWQIRSNDTAEHRYLIFDIIEEYGEIFFEIYFTQTYNPRHPYREGLHRYRALFDAETRILTVYMPFGYYWNGNALPYHVPNSSREVRPFLFIRR